MHKQPWHWVIVITTLLISTLLVITACVAPPPSEMATALPATAKPTVENKTLPIQYPPFDTSDWRTDFSKRTIEWDEILSGGPPKDGIPAIDKPTFQSVSEAAKRLGDKSPVILYQQGELARAYPLDILIWHEIVNDEVDGQPISVTFCPLCNASIIFDRRHNGQVLDFGTTGKLRNSDLIMYDRQSESWWQQALGEAIVGELTGQQLDYLPSQILSFGDFASEFPNGEVLAIPDEFNRSYGQNPYTGYDSSSQPFLFSGKLDPRLPATERVVGVEINQQARAYSYVLLNRYRVVNDELGTTPLVIFHKSGVASALDTSKIEEGKDVGSTAVFDRRIDGQKLTFAELGDGTFKDNETGSIWNLLGEATDGTLKGKQLTRIISFDHFWFAWRAFYPETEVWVRSEA